MKIPDDCEKQSCFDPIPEEMTLPIDELRLSEWACCSGFATLVYQRRIRLEKTMWVAFVLDDNNIYHGGLVLSYCPCCGAKMKDKPPILKAKH